MRRCFCAKQLAFIALILCGAALSNVAAQDLERFEPIVVDGNNNETTKAQLDLLAKKAGDDKLIILIARLGRAESTRRLNRRRLRTLRDYLKTTRAISEQRIVTAEGDRARGAGRVEAYVDGKLSVIFTLDRNRDFRPEP